MKGRVTHLETDRGLRTVRVPSKIEGLAKSPPPLTRGGKRPAEEKWGGGKVWDSAVTVDNMEVDSEVQIVLRTDPVQAPVAKKPRFSGWDNWLIIDKLFRFNPAKFPGLGALDHGGVS